MLIYVKMIVIKIPRRCRMTLEALRRQLKREGIYSFITHISSPDLPSDIKHGLSATNILVDGKPNYPFIFVLAS